jgi:hypothetical protein
MTVTLTPEVSMSADMPSGVSKTAFFGVKLKECSF